MPPKSPLDIRGMIENPISLHHYYKFYKLKEYMYTPGFADANFMWALYGARYKTITFGSYKSYVEVKFRKYL
jgi:hypothetical protein